MFICENCKEQQDKGIAPIMCVTKQRRKVYPQRTQEMMVQDDDGKETYRETVVIDKGGTGIETVKEIRCCEKCAKKVAPVIVNEKPLNTVRF